MKTRLSREGYRSTKLDLGGERIRPALALALCAGVLALPYGCVVLGGAETSESGEPYCEEGIDRQGLAAGCALDLDCDSCVDGGACVDGLASGGDGNGGHPKGGMCTTTCATDSDCAGLSYSQARGVANTKETWTCASASGGRFCAVDLVSTKGPAGDICDGCGGISCAGDCIGCPGC